MISLFYLLYIVFCLVIVFGNTSLIFQNLLIIHIVPLHMNYRNLGKVSSIGFYLPVHYGAVDISSTKFGFKELYSS